MALLVDFNLYLITDRRQAIAGDLVAVVRAALEAGVRVVQLREKDLPDAELLPLADSLRSLTLEYQARLLINSRIDIALAVSADGVHLPSSFPQLASARQQLGAGQLLGVSTHSLVEIAAATAAGADFVTFGPVFPTPSKLPFGDPVGVAALKDACAQCDVPVYALGGISLARLTELQLTGMAGVALIGGIIAARDPGFAARNYLDTFASFPSGKKLPD
jgi:thiamine-phosphate pyrophosphorylase